MEKLCITTTKNPHPKLWGTFSLFSLVLAEGLLFSLLLVLCVKSVGALKLLF